MSMKCQLFLVSKDKNMDLDNFFNSIKLNEAEKITDEVLTALSSSGDNGKEIARILKEIQESKARKADIKKLFNKELKTEEIKPNSAIGKLLANVGNIKSIIGGLEQDQQFNSSNALNKAIEYKFGEIDSDDDEKYDLLVDTANTIYKKSKEEPAAAAPKATPAAAPKATAPAPAPKATPAPEQEPKKGGNIEGAANKKNAPAAEAGILKWENTGENPPAMRTLADSQVPAALKLLSGVGPEEIKKIFNLESNSIKRQDYKKLAALYVLFTAINNDAAKKFIKDNNISFSDTRLDRMLDGIKVTFPNAFDKIDDKQEIKAIERKLAKRVVVRKATTSTNTPTEAPKTEPEAPKTKPEAPKTEPAPTEAGQGSTTPAPRLSISKAPLEKLNIQQAKDIITIATDGQIRQALAITLDGAKSLRRNTAVTKILTSFNIIKREGTEEDKVILEKNGVTLRHHPLMNLALDKQYSVPNNKRTGTSRSTRAPAPTPAPSQREPSRQEEPNKEDPKKEPSEEEPKKGSEDAGSGEEEYTQASSADEFDELNTKTPEEIVTIIQKKKSEVTKEAESIIEKYRTQTGTFAKNRLRLSQHSVRVYDRKIKHLLNKARKSKHDARVSYSVATAEGRRLINDLKKYGVSGVVSRLSKKPGEIYQKRIKDPVSAYRGRKDERAAKRGPVRKEALNLAKETGGLVKDIGKRALRKGAEKVSSGREALEKRDAEKRIKPVSKPKPKVNNQQSNPSDEIVRRLRIARQRITTGTVRAKKEAERMAIHAKEMATKLGLLKLIKEADKIISSVKNIKRNTIGKANPTPRVPIKKSSRTNYLRRK